MHAVLCCVVLRRVVLWCVVVWCVVLCCCGTLCSAVQTMLCCVRQTRAHTYAPTALIFQVHTRTLARTRTLEEAAQSGGRTCCPRRGHACGGSGRGCGCGCLDAGPYLCGAAGHGHVREPAAPRRGHPRGGPRGGDRPRRPDHHLHPRRSSART